MTTCLTTPGTEAWRKENFVREQFLTAWNALRESLAAPDRVEPLTGNMAKAEELAGALFAPVLEDFRRGPAAVELAGLHVLAGEMRETAAKAAADVAAAKAKLDEAVAGSVVAAVLKARAALVKVEEAAAFSSGWEDDVASRLAAAGRAAEDDLLRRAVVVARAAAEAARAETAEARKWLAEAITAEVPGVHLREQVCELLTPNAVRNRFGAELRKLKEPQGGAARALTGDDNPARRP